MPHKFNAARRHKFDKVQYRVINWAEYNDSVDHVCFPFDWFAVFSLHQERGETTNRRKEFPPL